MLYSQTGNDICGYTSLVDDFDEIFKGFHRQDVRDDDIDNHDHFDNISPTLVEDQLIADDNLDNFKEDDVIVKNILIILMWS